jgi:methylmalonyl-CoA epimerase
MVRIHHVGIACREVRSKAEAFRALGFAVHGPELVERQKVRLSFAEAGSGSIELLEPAAEDSPIAGFLAKKGEGLHHVALQVRSLEEAMRSLEGRVQWTGPAGPGARGTKVAFIHPRSAGGVLLELVEDPGRP